MRAGIFSGADAELSAERAARARPRRRPRWPGRNLSAEVSIAEPYTVPAPSARRIGTSRCSTWASSSPRSTTSPRAASTCTCCPQTVTLDDVLGDRRRSALFFSNGPGDPAASDEHVALLRRCSTPGCPFFGICFGNQLLGRALGLGTYKLPFGHRGINQPVLDKRHRPRRDHRAQPRLRRRRAARGRPSTRPPASAGVEVSHVGLNDDVVEGLELPRHPRVLVQYHPEAAAGPHDANYLFDRFRRHGPDRRTATDQKEDD